MEITVLTMRDHGVEDYAELRDMDVTDVGVLRDDDRACLDELGQYLAASDAWHRFGVWLLHAVEEGDIEGAPPNAYTELDERYAHAVIVAALKNARRQAPLP
jgi:hypothetical protein